MSIMLSNKEMTRLKPNEINWNNKDWSISYKIYIRFHRLQMLVEQNLRILFGKFKNYVSIEV